MTAETVITTTRLPADEPHVIARGQVTEHGLMVDADGMPLGVLDLGSITWEIGDATPRQGRT